MKDYRTSNTLLAKLQGKTDEQAWIFFAELYSPFIYSLLSRYELSQQDKEDLYQVVSVKIWKALTKLMYQKEKGCFRNWIAFICRNSVYNFMKLNATKAAKNKLADSDEYLLSMGDESLNEEEEREWQLFVSKQAWKNIQRLFKETHLQVYKLITEGSCAKEAASELGIAENTAFVYYKKVHTTMVREIRHLSRELDGY